MFSSSRPRIVVINALGLAAGLLGACQPSRPAPKDPAAEAVAALEAHGYAHAPKISAITLGDPGFILVNGEAPADSRVRFSFTDPLKGGAQAVGVTADGQGRFRAEVPITSNGGLYDITVDDGGRPRQAEGRLFVPPGRPDQAVLLRAGVPSRLMWPKAPGIAVADYDAAGAFAVSGRVAPYADVTVIVNNEIRDLGRSDPHGDFDAATQIPKPGATPQIVTVIVQTAKAEFRRDVQVVAPSGPGDHFAAVPGGWRVDWQIPGGGEQSTVVF